MQYRLRVTDPQQKGVSADLVVDSKMDFLSLHYYLESLLSIGAGGVATFVVIDHAGQRGVELTLFDAEGGDVAQRLMEDARLEEYVEPGGVRFDYAFGLFLDQTLHVEVTERYLSPLRHDVPACIAMRGAFEFASEDPLLRNLDDIEELLRASGGYDGLDNGE